MPKGYKNDGTKLGFKKGHKLNFKCGKVTIKCLLCDKETKHYLSSRRQYCSKKCAYKDSGKKVSGEKSGTWKGAGVGYYALHHWVRQWKGKPDFCIDCLATKEERELEWSNIDHKYKRDLNDYVGRCHSCHKIYDLKLESATC